MATTLELLEAIKLHLKRESDYCGQPHVATYVVNQPRLFVIITSNDGPHKTQSHKYTWLKLFIWISNNVINLGMTQTGPTVVSYDIVNPASLDHLVYDVDAYIAAEQYCFITNSMRSNDPAIALERDEAHFDYVSKILNNYLYEYGYRIKMPLRRFK